MTPDERLDALRTTVELLLADVQDLQNATRANTEAIGQLTAEMKTLKDVALDTTSNVRSLMTVMERFAWAKSTTMRPAFSVSSAKPKPDQI